MLVGGFGNVMFPPFPMLTFNGNFVNCTLVGKLKEGFDNELLWWEDVKQRIKDLISSHSRRLSRKRGQKRSSLQKSFNLIVSKLNTGSTDPNLLLQRESLKTELEKLDGFEAEGARIRSRAGELEEGEKPSKHFYRLESAQFKTRLISSVRAPGRKRL